MQPGGTGAGVARGAPYVIAGKTGTAQNTSRKGNISANPHSLPLSLRHQAWFIAYAPVDNPRIAVAVMVEHGGFGASTAGPIARKIMDAYLLGKMPEPEHDPDVIATHSSPSPTGSAVGVGGGQSDTSGIASVPTNAPVSKLAANDVSSPARSTGPDSVSPPDGREAPSSDGRREQRGASVSR